MILVSALVLVPKFVSAYSEGLLQERASWYLQLLWTHLSFQDCGMKHTQAHD